MKHLNRVIIGLVVLVFQASAFAYSVSDRYRLLEDKFKTEDMLRPFGHDFIIDVNVAANKNLLDFVDDVDGVMKKDEADRLAAAQALLEKYKDTEQTVKIGSTIGIPIFSFSAFGAKIVPDLRFQVLGGANLGVRTEPLTADLLIQIVPSDLVTAHPELATYIRDQFAAGNYSDGDNLFSDPVCAAAGITDCDKYQYSEDTPNLVTFAKADAKAGLLFNYFVDDSWFGYLNLYALYRTDFLLRVNAASMIKDTEAIDFPDEKKKQVFLDLDYKLGYKWDRFSVFGLIEELKITRLSENEAKAGALIYENDPLLRLQADAKFELSFLSLVPFAGVHKRKGYGFGEGVYGGADLGAYVWGDRLGLQFRTMVDKEHLTLSPRMKLWLMQLEYSLKTPMKKTVDDVKVSTLHSVDLRFFF